MDGCEASHTGTPAMSPTSKSSVALPVSRSAYGHISDRLEALKSRQFSSGRRAAIEALDCLLGDTDNIQELYTSLQTLFSENPAAFVRDFARLFIAPRMLEPVTERSVASEAETPLESATRTLRDAISLAFQSQNPAAVVAARRELNILIGLHKDDGEMLTAETLRRELELMQSSIAGGNGVGGNGRHKIRRPNVGGGG